MALNYKIYGKIKLTVYICKVSVNFGGFKNFKLIILSINSVTNISKPFMHERFTISLKACVMLFKGKL